MVRTKIFSLVIILCVPLLGRVSHADYAFPGSAALQPLAVLEPAAPDSLFHIWTGDLENAGRRNLGFSSDSLRNSENSKDWDTILAATASFRSGKRVLFGITLPYIIRDPNFKESDLLDLRVFARMRIFGSPGSMRLSGELSAIFPTANTGTLYPFTLDSTVVGGRLALAGGSGRMRTGATVGYQQYLATLNGSDSDLTYGVWLERSIGGPWSFVGEFYGSKHTHSGAPGDIDVTDDYFQAGVRRTLSSPADVGLSVGRGVGSDAIADLRVMATAVFRFGGGEKAPRETGRTKSVQRGPGEAQAPPPTGKSIQAYQGIVVVMVAEGITDRDTEKRITHALQVKGYATGMNPVPGVRITGENILYYNPGMLEKALAVSRLLISGGTLKDLQVRESSTRLSHDWLLLVPAGGRK